MMTLDEEISALKAEIEGYKMDLKNALTSAEKSEIRGLIKSSRDNLSYLLKQKKDVTKG